jgi:hypothetical protein
LPKKEATEGYIANRKSPILPQRTQRQLLVKRYRVRQEYLDEVRALGLITADQLEQMHELADQPGISFLVAVVSDRRGVRIN